MASSSFPVTVFSAALPDVAADLNTSTSVISWVVAGPLLALAVATPTAGKLGDLIGHRQLYLYGFGLATLFSGLTALAWNAPALIALRVLGQGMGAATLPAALAIIMHTFPPNQRAAALGWWSAISALSPTLGAVFGGLLIDLTSWRAVFIAQAIISAAALVPALRLLPHTPRRPAVRFDLLGALTLGLAAGALLFAVNRGPHLGWSSPLVVAGLIISPIMLALFVAVEQRAAAPLLPLEHIRAPGFALPTFSSIFSMSAYMGALVVTPFLLGGVFGYDTKWVALILTARALAFSAGSWVGGQLEQRLGLRTEAVAGASVMCCGLALTGIASFQMSLTLVVVALFLTGGGQGFARPALVASIGASVGDQNVGVGSGAFTMVGQVGASIGITAMTALLGTDPGANRFGLIYLAGAAVAAVSIGLLGKLPSRSAT